MDNEDNIFVAPIAFGMGVDKPNVRHVYHYEVSESLDSYFQEAGRAGRDDASAEAILFSCAIDLGLRRFQIGSGKSASQTPLRLVAALKDMKVSRLEPIEQELDLSLSALWRALLQLEAVGALCLDANGHIRLEISKM